MISRHLSESRAKSNILPTRKCNSSLDLCNFLFGKTPQIHDYPTVGQASQLTERMVRIFNCSSFFSRVHASLCCCCSIPDPEIDLIQSFTRTRSFQRRPPLFQNKTTLIINNPLKLSLQNSHIAPVPPWGAWFCGDSHPVVYPQRFARCPPYHQAWHQTNGLKWTKLDFFKRNTLTYTPIKSYQILWKQKSTVHDVWCHHFDLSCKQGTGLPQGSHHQSSAATPVK